jgi:hypothetical protein
MVGSGNIRYAASVGIRLSSMDIPRTSPGEKAGRLGAWGASLFRGRLCEAQESRAGR